MKKHIMVCDQNTILIKSKHESIKNKYKYENTHRMEEHKSKKCKKDMPLINNK